MGSIFNIQRFSTHDGRGIRTVVFFKGCPLSCVWCHNPESKMTVPEIFYDSAKCIGCRACESMCKNLCHSFDNDKHFFSRTVCKSCMDCASVCPSKALDACGGEMSAEEVVHEILRDRDFYEQSGGGVTLSGGEPLMQYDFALSILKKSKEKGIGTAIETSGYCKRSLVEIAEYVDTWLYDIKLTDEKLHIEYTGVSRRVILENLRFLDNIDSNIILRCPIIPDINLTDAHFDGIVELAASLNNVCAIHLEPYHPLGTHKSELLGKLAAYGNKDFLAAEALKPFIDRIRSKVDADIEIV